MPTLAQIALGEHIRRLPPQRATIDVEYTRDMRVEAEVEERRGLVWPFSAVGLCAALLSFVALHPALSATTFIVSAVVVTLLSFLALVRTAPSKRVTGKRRVSVDERGLSLDGKLVLPHCASTR
jgi:hypothetical protein